MLTARMMMAQKNSRPPPPPPPPDDGCCPSALQPYLNQLKEWAPALCLSVGIFCMLLGVLLTVLAYSSYSGYRNKTAGPFLVVFGSMGMATGIGLYVIKRKKDAKENKIRLQKRQEKIAALKIEERRAQPVTVAPPPVTMSTLGPEVRGAEGGADPPSPATPRKPGYANPGYRYHENMLNFSQTHSVTSEKSPRHVPFREIELSSPLPPATLPPSLPPLPGGPGSAGSAVSAERFYTGKRWVDLVSDDAETPDNLSMDLEPQVFPVPLPDPLSLGPLGNKLAGDPIPLIAALSKQHNLLMDDTDTPTSPQHRSQTNIDIGLAEPGEDQSTSPNTMDHSPGTGTPNLTADTSPGIGTSNLTADPSPLADC